MGGTDPSFPSRATFSSTRTDVAYRVFSRFHFMVAGYMLVEEGASESEAAEARSEEHTSELQSH